MKKNRWGFASGPHKMSYESDQPIDFTSSECANKVGTIIRFNFFDHASKQEINTLAGGKSKLIFVLFLSHRFNAKQSDVQSRCY